MQLRSGEVASTKEESEQAAAQATSALAEAQEAAKRAEQLQHDAEQKQQATAAQSMSISRERLQLASEQRDITECRQKAERDAEEAIRRARQLEEEIVVLKRQIATAEKTLPPASKLRRSWTRMARDGQAAGSVGGVAQGRAVADTTWDEDHAHAQQVLQEQRNFLKQFQPRPGVAGQAATMPMTAAAGPPPDLNRSTDSVPVAALASSSLNLSQSSSGNTTYTFPTMVALDETTMSSSSLSDPLALA